MNYFTTTTTTIFILYVYMHDLRLANPRTVRCLFAPFPLFSKNKILYSRERSHDPPSPSPFHSTINSAFEFKPPLLSHSINPPFQKPPPPLSSYAFHNQTSLNNSPTSSLGNQQSYSPINVYGNAPSLRETQKKKNLRKAPKAPTPLSYVHTYIIYLWSPHHSLHQLVNLINPRKPLSTKKTLRLLTF